MKKIPEKLKNELASDPFYKVCARAGYHSHICDGRITWEHAIIFAGSQVNARYAIVPLCAKAHAVDYHQDGGDLKKEVNVWIALNRASDEQLAKISKAVNYARLKDRLNAKYGQYDESIAIKSYVPPKAQISPMNGVVKPTWYPLSQERKDKIQKLIEIEKHNTGSRRSLFEVIDNLIDEMPVPEKADFPAELYDETLKINY